MKIFKLSVVVSVCCLLWACPPEPYMVSPSTSPTATSTLPPTPSSSLKCLSESFLNQNFTTEQVYGCWSASVNGENYKLCFGNEAIKCAHQDLSNQLNENRPHVFTLAKGNESPSAVHEYEVLNKELRFYEPTEKCATANAEDGKLLLGDFINYPEISCAESTKTLTWSRL